MRSLTPTLLRSQRGLALPMALGIMMVLAIVSLTLITITSSGESSTRRVSDDDRAFSLAEAGLNNALAVLHASTNPLDDAAVGSDSEPLNGGTAAYSSSLSGSTWTLTGTGTMPSSITDASDVVRTASLQVNVTTNDTPWQYLFAGADTGCLTINNNTTVAAPIYTRGDLCLGNNAEATGSPIQVEGIVDLANNASIGSAGSPIAEGKLVGGCVAPGNGNPHPCTPADRVYVMALSQVASGLTKPAVDLPGWYANAKPGPSHACTVGSVPGGFDDDTTLNRSRADFQLTSGAGYDCQYWEGSVMVGQLAWNPSSNTLTVAGTIFFDGTIRLSGDVVYSGRGTIYSSETVRSSNNTKLCGVAGCNATWDPQTNLVVIVAGDPTAQYGFELNNNSVYQGAAYVVTGYHADNGAENWGPVIADQIVIDQNGGQTISLGSVPPGAPGFEETIQPVSGSWRG